ncbi:MAG TPA: xanthine dehydrogenase family protein subunit M [Ktedonobacteraceae bacterium]|nr:xanthine dehydrogenase family protein subunit M [Ktedonobacteraceae bacterium]
MQPFKYTTPANEVAALAIVAGEDQAMYVAGGTNLIDLMKLDVETPAHLVDITALPLNEVTPFEDGIRIGALARNSDVAYHDMVHEHYPMLSQALLSGASGQLRNMATIGGNLMQRTRCPYFRDAVQACNKRVPGSGCAALSGYNREHAILGASTHCIAVHPSDLCVALIALDARIQTHSVRGERSIPITDFYLLPQDHPERETVLARDELIVAVDVPSLPFAGRSLYLKVRDRASYAFSLVSVAVALDIQDGSIREARLALGGVATRPWRLYEAEQLLAGKPAQEESYQEAASIATREAFPQRDNGFKIDLSRRAIVHALTRTGALA